MTSPNPYMFARELTPLSLFKNVCLLTSVKIPMSATVFLSIRVTETVAYDPVNPVSAAPGASICSVIVARASEPVTMMRMTTAAAKETEASVRLSNPKHIG
jgi:hypothetical protein